MKSNQGFTLIELMIVLVVAAILASVAIPGYREYVLRSNRRAAQAAMVELVSRQHQFFAANREFGDEADFDLPPEIAANYTLDIDLDAGPPPAFTIELTPKADGRQAGDATLTVNNDGVKTPADKW